MHCKYLAAEVTQEECLNCYIQRTSDGSRPPRLRWLCQDDNMTPEGPPRPPLTQNDVRRLDYGSLCGAICNALQTNPLRCRRVLEHQLRTYLSMQAAAVPGAAAQMTVAQLVEA